MESVARKKAGITRLVISLVILGLATWIFFNRQHVLDEINLRRFSPSSEIAALASSTTMTPLAERYFYVSFPEINNATDFNTNCKTAGEQSIILGCYTAQRIYLYDVEDPRLPGVKEVTAAHEMLHSAYERLSDSEKAHVDTIVEAQVAQVNDSRINDLIELYTKSEPGQLTNEMHSILATELSELTPELEEYYAKYFEDRQKVVNYSSQYEGVFIEIKNNQTSLEAELERLNSTIKLRSDNLNLAIAELNEDINQFNAKAEAGEFDSESQFNAERGQLEAQQSELRQERAAIERLIDEFNKKRDELIALNNRAESLNQSLDSTPGEVPSL